MAKLVLTLPALPDPDALQDHTGEMDDEAKLIQSMRGFACGVSMLIPAYHFLLAAEIAHPEAEAGDSYPRLVMTCFMKETMLDTVLLHLRRLFERSDSKNKKRASLGAGTIAELLVQDDLREALRLRSREALGEGAIGDEEFGHRIEILALQCAMHVEAADSHPALARVFQQAELVRRAANKRAAHITLDEYNIGIDDIHQLVSNAVAIARSIQAILGLDACDTDYAEVDAGAYEASEQVFGCSHGAGRLLDEPRASGDEQAPEDE